MGLNERSIVAYAIGAGEDPLPTLRDAWSRGERVLLVSNKFSAHARQQLLSTTRVGGTLTHKGNQLAPQFTRLETCPSTASVIIETSGSSASPRLIELGVDALIASARIGAGVIPFGPGDFWHASLPATHIGGLMIHVRSLVLGGAVRSGAPPQCWADLHGVTHVSLVASQLARLLGDSNKPPSTLKAVILGGGPSSQFLRDRALSRGLPLFATYGMTETSSQVATGRIAIGDPATLAGSPLPGIQVSIDSTNNEIIVDGPTLARTTLVQGKTVPISAPLRTRDIGSFDTHGRLLVLGRLDAMFISGGRNIHPETIERALTQLPGVLQACVVGVPDEKWGMRPVAFVQFLPKSIGAATHDSLAGRLRECLEPHLVPDTLYEMPGEDSSCLKPSRASLGQRLARGERFRKIQ